MNREEKYKEYKYRYIHEVNVCSFLTKCALEALKQIISEQRTALSSSFSKISLSLIQLAKIKCEKLLD